MRMFENGQPGKPDITLSRTNILFDAFGRGRVSQPQTIFDSKLSSGKLPEFWNEVVSANASATHERINSCVHMTVTANNAYAIRQTYQRWNYMPGKSQLGTFTAKFPTANGVTARVGLFHGDYDAPYVPHDGLYFEVSNGIMSLNIVKGTEIDGVVEVESAAQATWNMDKLDGTGPSGKTADWSKVQILVVDFQWLGAGGVRFGVEIDGVLVYVHEFQHAGLVDSVYMHSGTQPIRYEIRSTGGTGTLDHICSSVASEGGTARTGISFSVDTNGTAIPCPLNAIQMVIASKLDKANPDVQMLVETATVLNLDVNSAYRWVVLRNPTITGTPNWVAGPVDTLKVWRNAGSSITMTGGFPLASGYASRASRESYASIDPTLGLGVSINGTEDIVALGVEPLIGAASCSGGIALRALV